MTSAGWVLSNILADSSFAPNGASVDVGASGNKFRALYLSGLASVGAALTIGGLAAAATTATTLTKLTSSIADATATTILTITIPNAAHSASIYLQVDGRLGAGGAIGADEASGTVGYLISVTRTAGVNAVATISTAFGVATSSVAGAATITVTADLGAVSGAVGASNTIAIRTTITKGSGSSANHTCTATATILNANATGISIA